MATVKKHQTEPQAEPQTEKADTPKSAGFSAYIGPNILGVIQAMKIYPVGRDDALKLPELLLAVEKKPGIADLVVDGLTLPEDRIKVKTPGEELYKKYRALLRN